MPSNQLLASKIVFRETPPSGRSAPSFNTAVVAFEGVCQKGPINTPTLCLGFSDFTRIFGSYVVNGDLAASVEAFFNEGGSVCYVNRIVHFTAGTATPATAAVATLSLTNSVPVATLRVDGKYMGTYGNALTIKSAAASSGVATQFNLSVLNTTSVILESWINLDMDPASPNYAESVVNNERSGSILIKVTNLLPAGGTPATNVPAAHTTALSGGNDGLTSIADVDFVGTQAAWTGLYAFDRISSITILAVPGLATAAVHQGMITYCEIHRQGMIQAILDCPANNDATAINTYVITTAALVNLSEFGAIYWPRVKVANPDAVVYGAVATATIPPSGVVCGVIARTDNARSGGVWDQPAGTETGKLMTVLGFETDDVKSEDVRDLVFPNRINPLTTQDGFPRYIDGARTLKGNGNFPSLGQRRGVSYSERSIKAALEPLRHKNNNVSTRNECQRTVWSFLNTQCSLGAFASKVPDEAFYVDFGDALQQSPNIIDGAWGVATTQPAEFIRMNVSQDTRAADAANG